ncbi:MAG: hypothetical protein GZ091_07115 [Paludibacter sp.]|nr:hypothetical protein [Paludibacter sp.]
MKNPLTLLFLIVYVATIFAQSTSKGDSRTGNQNTVIRIEGTQNGWTKSDVEGSSTSNTQSSDNENVTFNSTADGIYISIIKGTNKIKLFALTGQLLLNGDLTQGRFFIPTRKGIYFLRINNKSYKVVCK